MNATPGIPVVVIFDLPDDSTDTGVTAHCDWLGVGDTPDEEFVRLSWLNASDGGGVEAGYGLTLADALASPEWYPAPPVIVGDAPLATGCGHVAPDCYPDTGPGIPWEVWEVTPASWTR